MTSCFTRYYRRTLAVSATLLLSIPTLRLSAMPAQLAPNADVSSAQRSSKSVQTDPTSPEFPSSLDELLTALRSEREKSLKTILHHLNIDARKLTLTNDEIDLVLIELERISVSDAYQEPWRGKGKPTPENARLVFANRMGARTAIESLKCQRIANDFRALPMQARVKGILEYVEGRTPTRDTPRHASDWFRGELWRIGSDAVPFILERAEESPEFRLMYTDILSSRGDSRGIAFILGTLTATPENSTADRCHIIKRLRPFDHPRITQALVKAIQDEVRGRYNVRQYRGQQARPANRNEPQYIVKYYPLRNCASRVLADMSNTRWNLLFGEDPKSWQAWWNSDDRKAFDPATIARTHEELESLLGNFTYAAMDAYMSSSKWYEGSTASFVVSRLRSDLIKLGPQVVPILIHTYRSIAEEFPVWEDDLRRWTRMLFTALDTPESRTAARALAD